jgi:hypothetical protein
MQLQQCPNLFLFQILVDFSKKSFYPYPLEVGEWLLLIFLEEMAYHHLYKVHHANSHGK